MNFTNDTQIQNYNVAAGRVIQMPCFLDQPEPPDGFRAVVFATPTIGMNGPYINQTGNNWDGQADAGLIFDLTRLVQQNSLSRARSIQVALQAGTGFGNPGGYTDAALYFDSGMLFPFGMNPYSNYGSTFLVADFVSANPVFGLWISESMIKSGSDFYFTVTVTNFKMSASAFMGGYVTNAS